MQLIENLNWRYATKKYDPSKKVAPQDITLIKEAVRLSAASYGLQSYKILDIEDHELRAALRPLTWGQSQATEASHLFVFCNYIDVSDQDIEDQMRLKAEVSNKPINAYAGYGEFVKGKVKEKSGADIPHWTAKQTYIALAYAMVACAELRIDCTPMEGFDKSAYNEKLGLVEQGLSACVLLAVGYRHAEDTAQHFTKVRKPYDDIFSTI